MKKHLLLLAAVVIAFASCTKIPKFDPVKQASDDDIRIKAYLVDNGVTNAKKDTASGLYYIIVNPGTGSHPTVESTITATYSGKLLDGTVFAPAGSAATGVIGGFIKGWRIGLPLIAAGGEIEMLVPSGLAYGNTSPGSPIPANAVLFFDIKLNNIN